MNVGVIGCGFVGLSNAAILAHNEKVFIFDIDQKKMDKIERKEVPFDDLELSSLLSNNHIFLKRCHSEKELICCTELIIIALPTDYDVQNSKLDTSIIEETIARILEDNRKTIIIIRSTVPVGFTEKMKHKFDYNDIFFMPEFLREGRAYSDSLNPERIVIGGDIKSSKIAKLFLEAMKKGGGGQVKVQYTTTTEAETIKLFSNAFLAMRVSFFNELDIFAEKKGMDCSKLIQGICSDSRIGNYYNCPSFGYGGYCLPKDTAQISNSLKPDNILLNAVIKSNESRIAYIADKINHMEGCVGIYRLQAKKGTNSIRNSVMLDIIKILSDQGRTIYVYEPVIQVKSWINNMVFVNSLRELDQKCDVIIANRKDPELEPYKNKIYTRDI